MPKKFDDCVKEVNKKIKSGEIKKTYKCGKGKKKRCKSNAFAICKSSMNKSKKKTKKKK